MPTPIFRLYQEAFALSIGMVTAIFAAYASSLLAPPLVVGSLSDPRRPHKPAGAGAAARHLRDDDAFLAAEFAEALIVARLLQGGVQRQRHLTLAAAMLDLSREHVR